MRPSEKSLNWRQKSVHLSVFSYNSVDLLERHLMLHLGAGNRDVEAPQYISHRIQSVNTTYDLKFPNIDSIVGADTTDAEAMFPVSNHIPEISRVSAETEDRATDRFPKNDTTRVQGAFYSARELLEIRSMKKNVAVSELDAQKILTAPKSCGSDFSFAATKKSLGGLGRLGNSNVKRFVSPVRSKSPTAKDVRQPETKIDSDMEQLLQHPDLKNIDPKMVEMISNEIIHKFKSVDWSEIAGLDYAKSIIKEAVVYPLLRPDIFTGLRRPPRGILLFGPPGTGKTLIGKCIASQSSATFFSISSASLTSKWMGEGEKMVRALFAVAQARQPAVIFIDEIDSLLSQRSENENEGTRRLKTEFLVRLDGAATTDDDRVLIVGATNRPQELDEAVRRRFVKRLYVPLPELNARTEILANLLKTVDNCLDANDLKDISQLVDGYSGADMDSLCREASMEPLRSLPVDSIMTFSKDMLRPVSKDDFRKAIEKIRPSVSQKDLDQYVEWNKTYGSSF